MKRFNFCLAACGWLLAGIAAASPVVTVFEATGSPAAVTSARDALRVAIGGGTVSGANGSFGGVRREINWDGVPNAIADPMLLPSNFFNTTSPRGVTFSTPGTGFMVSSNAGQSVPIDFGFGAQLEAFSAQRMFTAVGSVTTDVHFFVPGTDVAATTSAFGVVFADVDTAGTTSMQFFDRNDQLIFARDVLPSGGDQLFSFLGITLDASLIGRVRITSGTATIVANGILGSGGDLVVMDDFLYAEPVRVAAGIPEPSTLALVGLAAVGGVIVRKRLSTSGRPDRPRS